MYQLLFFLCLQSTFTAGGFFFFLVLIVLLQTSIAFSSTISSFPFTLFCIQRGEEGDISIGAIVSWGVLQVIKFHLMQ